MSSVVVHMRLYLLNFKTCKGIDIFLLPQNSKRVYLLFHMTVYSVFMHYVSLACLCKSTSLTVQNGQLSWGP